MRNNIFADFESANWKMKKATDTSDLESRSETQLEQSMSQQSIKNLTKRKILKTTLTKFASFEVSEDESGDTGKSLFILPEPPKFKSVMAKKVKTLSISSEAIEILQSQTGNDDKAMKVDSITVPPRHLSTDKSTTELLHKILRKQNIIQSTLADLAEDISEIKSKIGHTSPNSMEDSISLFTAVNLPVNDAADLEILENYSSNDMAMNTAVKEIAASGGKNAYEFIYRATQKQQTNKFASRNSYYGRQKKLKFNLLKLNELLKKSSLRVFHNSSEKEAEIVIAKWLRRCTERAKKE